MNYDVSCENCGGGVFRRYHISLLDNNNHDVIFFFHNIKSYIKETLTHELQQRKGIKWFLCINIQYVKHNIDGEEIYSQPYFRSLMETTTNEIEIDTQIDNAFVKILSSAHEFHREGSNWVFDKIVGFDICIATYQPLAASSYIELPEHLQNKKAIINIKNDDNKCFLYCVLAGLDKRNHDHPNRVSNYIDFIDTLNLEGISFPVPISQVARFERNNNLSINVYGYESEIFPIYITNKRDMTHINLLLIEKEGNQHYCLIRNMSRLFSDRNRHNGAQYPCNYCLHFFSSSKLLSDHIPYCNVHGVQKTSFPSDDEKMLEFKNYANGLKIPFIIVADWETFPKAIHTVHPPKNNSFTSNVNYHEPASFCYIIVSTDPRYYRKPVIYRGPNAVKIFIKQLKKEAKWIEDILSKIEPVHINTEFYRKLMEQNNCHICGSSLTHQTKYLDHDHVTGEARGYSCNICNLNFKFKNFIPVIFHNLSSFDGHLILNGLEDLKDNVSCVPTSMEKYLSFTIKNLKFIDSYKFLPSSLETLVLNLKDKGLDQFRITQYWTPIDTLELMTRKQIYPYNYLDRFEKFHETALPSKDKFFNDLTQKHISDDEYKHAQLVWERFNLKTLGDFHDIYLTYDVILLADVISYFRKLSLFYYKLDPMHYISLPGLSWDSCLRFTKIKLELITDVNQYNFLESGIKGGISVVSNRFSVANNIYLNNFNPEDINKFILSIDANGLYGFGQSQVLPTGGFAWLNQDEIDKLDINEIPEDSDIGYILEVDLYYPECLHSDHNDFPLAPEKIQIDLETLSPYSRNIARNLDINLTKIKKLIPNLRNKQKYITHYKNLQLYTLLGLEIIKIHRVLSFKQSDWMKPYIDFNTEKRAKSKSKFEQDFFKLVINSNFGKTIENLRKRINIQLVSCPNKMLKLISKPSFESFRIFNNNLVGIHLKKTNIKLNKPIYLGFSILELSKCKMYEHHYLVMKKHFPEIKLLYMDTDSLTYEIITENVYEDLKDIIQHFDTSNYPENHFLYSKENKKKLGFFKDETGGIPIKSFVGLRAKMYSYCLEDENNTERKSAKGIPKQSIKNKLTFSKYEKMLQFPSKFYTSSYLIQSKNHKVFTNLSNKLSLSPFDDKRFILANGFETLAHGHYLIPFLLRLLKDIWN